MIFTDIRLQNFRSYEDSSFELSNTVTIVVGPNTAGKTNLLEAVLMAAKGKSYRGTAKDLIKHNQEWARIDVHTSDNTLRTIKIIMAEDKATKTFEIDDKEYKRLPLAAQQPVVLFEPNSLRLLDGSPAKRRDYLDDIICQTTPGYPKVISDYKRALAQRNALLKSNRLKDIFIWDLKLSQLGAQIIKNRLEIVEKIGNELTETYQKIAKTHKDLKINYVSGTSLENYGSKLLSQLEKNIEKDARTGHTGFGPHRDEIEFLIDDNQAMLSASRGEMRTILLSIKSIELGIIEKARKIKPILLLDDVFSELDGARRKALTELVKNHQTIITTTDADIISKNFSQNCQIIPLNN